MLIHTNLQRSKVFSSSSLVDQIAYLHLVISPNTMDEGGTYLEDFLLSLEMLPNDVRRDFELVTSLLLIDTQTRRH